MSRRIELLLIAAVVWCNIGWLDTPHSRVAEANRLFKAGKYDDAAQRYGEALVDTPDSPLLNYNLANAQYKSGKFGEALKSYGSVNATEKDPQELARVAYNAGNAQFRLAASLESEKPQDALKGYAQALVAYRRAIGADSADHDAKFNYELTVKRIEDLKQKLERQKKKEEEKKQEEKQEQSQDQQQQNEQDDQQQGDGQEQEQNQSREPKDQQPEGPPQDQAGQEQPQADEPPPGSEENEEGAEAAAGSGSDKGAEGESGATEGTASDDEPALDPSQQEAAALLDSAKQEELTPEEFTRRVQGGAVADSAQDW